MKKTMLLFLALYTVFPLCQVHADVLQQRNPDGSLRQSIYDWNPDETAIVICDMWDKHWCAGATARVAEMAPAMDKVLQEARKQGILILHAPSDTLDFYEGTPQRERAINAPRAKQPGNEVRDKFKGLVEPPLPIDDSDGGCDCNPPCPDVNKNVWSREIDTLSMEEGDIVSQDHTEVYNALKNEGRSNVIVMGVHTNMCVLGRPFAIRAQVKNGMNVALMRDLTDTMYNSRMAPFVDHHRGTDLVIQHIEENWCPTITSSLFTGEAPFRFQSDERPHAVFILHEDEYDADKSVPAFAEAELAQKLGWRCTYLFGDGLNNIPGLEVLQDADLMVVFARRQVLPKEQLACIKAYSESGKPVVGIRTASHAFAPRGPIPKGHEAWQGFDPEILGGNYNNHHGNKGPGKPRTLIWGLPEMKDHPVLKGVNLDKVPTRSWLYKVSPLEAGAIPLMMGTLDDDSVTPEPVAWVNTGKWGNRVFSTSLGHQDEFKDPNFEQLLMNGILWAANIPARDKN